MYNKYDFSIVGAGLFAIVIAENMSSCGKKICIFDKKNNIGGNCYDYKDEETDVVCHAHGPHIFHISDENILAYIKKFTEFNEYKHIVYSKYKDKIYHFPINLSTINNFYNVCLTPSEVNTFIENEANRSGIKNPNNLEEKIISLIGEPLYKAFFLEYTIKQWGKHPKDLLESIIQRIPIRNNYNSGYYKKYFNGIPKDGYTEMFKRMLSNKNIDIELGIDFFEDKEKILKSAKHIIYTGEIDRFFSYEYGKLGYRGLRFEREVYDVQDFQGNAVINYPELKYEYTRICEPRHFYPEKWNDYSSKKTICFKEISVDGASDPYYPILDNDNKERLKLYLNEAKKLNNISFGGRLGEYKYYDMEDTIKSAIALSKKLISKI